MIFVVGVEENCYIFRRGQAISKIFSPEYSAMMALKFAARSLLNSKIYKFMVTYVCTDNTLFTFVHLIKDLTYLIFYDCMSWAPAGRCKGVHVHPLDSE
jgi:hypothetical protein